MKFTKTLAGIMGISLIVLLLMSPLIYAATNETLGEKIIGYGEPVVSEAASGMQAVGAYGIIIIIILLVASFILIIFGKGLSPSLQSEASGRFFKILIAIIIIAALVFLTPYILKGLHEIAGIPDYSKPVEDFLYGTLDKAGEILGRAFKRG